MSRSVKILMLLCLQAFNAVIFAEVSSTTGTIHFSVNSESVAVLSDEGLSIGSSEATQTLDVTGNGLISTSLFIGDVPSTSMASNLYIGGTMGVGISQLSSAIIEISGNTHGAVLVDTTDSDITVVLPSAETCSGRFYTIKKTSTLNSMWISGGGDLIDDQATIEFPSGNLDFCEVMSANEQWFIMNSSSISKVASDNLVAHWSFDETSGNTWTDSVSNYQAVSNLASVDSASGVFGSGANFQGGGVSQATVAHADALNLGEEWSISFWLIHRSFSESFENILEKGDHDVDGLRIRLGNYSVGADIRIQATGNGNRASGDIEASLSSSPIHVCITKSSSRVKFFINGILDGSHANIYQVITTDSDLVFPGKINGVLDEFMMYNKSLSSDQIYALYRGGK